MTSIEGRGADDIIDGDKYLNVRLTAGAGTTDLMEHVSTTGLFAPGTAGMTLQQAVFAGLVDPGNINIVREVVLPAAGLLTGTIDTALFSAPLVDPATQTDNYTIVNIPGGVRITDLVGTDGIDTLYNMERAGFCTTNDPNTGLCTAYEYVTIGGVPPVPAVSAASLSFAPRAVAAGPAATQVITLTNTGGGTLSFVSSAIAGINAASTASFTRTTTCAGIVPALGCTVTVTFDPTAAGALSATLNIVTSAGTVPVALTGTGVNNTAATGAPTISDTTPTEGHRHHGCTRNCRRRQRCSGRGELPVASEHDPGGRGQHRDRRRNDAVVHPNPGTGQPSLDGHGDLRRQRRLLPKHGHQQSRQWLVTCSSAAQLRTPRPAPPARTCTTVAAATTTCRPAPKTTSYPVTPVTTPSPLPVAMTPSPTPAPMRASMPSLVAPVVDDIVPLANNTTIGLRSISTVEAINASGFSGVRILGSALNDVLNFTNVTLTNIVSIDGGGGNDALTGSAAADVIIGRAGTDTLNGGIGNDTLEGGGGNDTMNGGNDNDTFRYLTVAGGFGADTITGFDANPNGGQDVINLAGLGINAGNFAAQCRHHQRRRRVHPDHHQSVKGRSVSTESPLRPSTIGDFTF